MEVYEIKTDLHTHTLASTHAYSTLEENCLAAASAGLEGINCSDHGPKLIDAPYEGHFSNLRVLPEEIHGIRVWKGAEVNLMDFEGTIDLSENTLNRLELIVASFHEPACPPGTKEAHTHAYLQALKNPHIQILGHTGSAAYPYDYETVVKEAAKMGKAIELNEASFHVRPSSIVNCREIIRCCKRYGAWISVDSDAHFCSSIGQYPNSLRLLAELEFPAEQIVNRSRRSVEIWLSQLKGV